MVPKVCIACYGRLADMVSEVINTLDVKAKFTVYKGLITKETVIPKELDDVDVFLSSGINAALLKTIVKKPVVTMDTRIPDIMSALEESLQYDKHPLIVPYNERYDCIDLLNRINPSNEKLEQRVFHSHAELWDIIEDFKKRGGKAIVGTALGCDYAEQLGLKGFFVRPKNALLDYTNIAVDAAIAIKKERLKNAELYTIIDYFDRGLILSNNDNIHVCNSEAVKIFSYLNKPIVNESLSSLLNEIEFISQTIDIEKIKSPTLNILCKINKKKYVVDFIPIDSSNDSLMVNFRSLESVEGDHELLQDELANKGFMAKHSFKDMSAYSPKFIRAIDIAKKYSQTSESIVILGETGVGKEVMASSIHNNSKRSRYPFIAVNCSAMNETLLESELFGYEDGAFTGARKGGKKGIFELADKGTIFLDEIGEINESIQVKLLRAIQEKEIMRVGGTKIISFDARIICATNKNLWELVKNHKFREDLYYRLNVLELTIPPLRERREDIFPLFLNFMSRETPNVITAIRSLKAEISSILESYDWPGNIRELENYAKTLSATLEPNANREKFLSLMEEFIDKKLNNTIDVDKYQLVDSHSKSFLSKAEIEKQRIRSALVETGGNRTRASELLGMSRATLWKKIKEYDIKL